MQAICVQGIIHIYTWKHLHIDDYTADTDTERALKKKKNEKSAYFSTCSCNWSTAKGKQLQCKYRQMSCKQKFNIN